MLGLITGYTVGSLSTIIYPFPTLIILQTKIGYVVTPPILTSATYAKSPICKEEFIELLKFIFSGMFIYLRT